MPLDRSVWLSPVTLLGTLPWNCPECAAARVRLKEGSLAEGETRASKALREHDAWGPEWIAGRFSCMLECPHCAAEIGVTGTYQIVDERGYADGEEVGSYVSYYQPLYFTESPHLIDIPRGTPDAVTEEVVRSFQFFWADPLACANRVRIAVELLLTAQRVNRSTGGPRTNKPRRMLKLHNRIELFGKKQPALAEQLMAIKWIGNAGSHADVVTREDLLDAFDILASVLDDLYLQRSRVIGALVRAINRRAAPRSARRPKSDG
jgi:hypothetical protein